MCKMYGSLYIMSNHSGLITIHNKCVWIYVVGIVSESRGLT